MKYRLLDLYCGLGGCSKGYSDAGFEITGIDIVKQKNYQFEFIQKNVLDLEPEYLAQFDAIHASPHAKATVIQFITLPGITLI